MYSTLRYPLQTHAYTRGAGATGLITRIKSWRQSMPDQSTATGPVFLSYASQDEEAAARICKTLRASGIEVWFDESELRGGDAWDSKIKKQIHHLRTFVPVISAHTNARAEGYFRGEWNLATRRLLNMAHDAPFLVPVVIDGTREVDARVPEEFLRTQWTRLPEGETPRVFADRVRQLLGGDGAAHSPSNSMVTEEIDSSAQGVVSVRPGGVSRSWRGGLALIASLLVSSGGILWYYQGESDSPSAKPMPVAASSVTIAAPTEKSIAVLHSKISAPTRTTLSLRPVFRMKSSPVSPRSAASRSYQERAR